MKFNSSSKFILQVFFTLTCFIFSKVNAQFIFSANDLNDFCKQAVIEDANGDFGFTVNYFKEYGYNRIKDSDNFQDKYGNKISVLTVSQIPEYYSLKYHINKPSANTIKNYQNELKNYFNFTNLSAKTSYIIDYEWIIDFENKPGKECVLEFFRNAKGDAFIPAKKIDNSHLEVSSYKNGTYIKVAQGDKIYLKASGNIVLGAWAGSGGPEGIDGYQSYSKVSEFKHGALLCYIDDTKNYGKPFFKVGLDCSFTATRSGTLKFIINDDDPSNNSGSFIVEYSINKPLISSIQNQPKTLVSQKNQSNISNKKVENEYDLRRNLPRQFNGKIINTSVNLKSSCYMTMYENKNGSYRLKGKTDNVNLFGVWDLDGYEVIKEKRKMYQFIGYVDLGYEGTGFPRGTSAPFKILVEITEYGMTGTYELGIFKYSRYKQFGTISLN